MTTQSSSSIPWIVNNTRKTIERAPTMSVGRRPRGRRRQALLLMRAEDVMRVCVGWSTSNQDGAFLCGLQLGLLLRERISEDVRGIETVPPAWVYCLDLPKCLLATREVEVPLIGGGVAFAGARRAVWESLAEIFDINCSAEAVPGFSKEVRGEFLRGLAAQLNVFNAVDQALELAASGA